MQINTPKQNFHPDFQRKLELPTRCVLECVTNKLTTETRKNPSGMLETFGKIFKLKKSEVIDIPKTPMMFDIYMLSSGSILKKDNIELKILSEKIRALPAEKQYEKINEVVNEIGEKLNVDINI